MSCHDTDSLKVKLSDGPGKCAGRLEIQHEGKWKAVRKSEYVTPVNSDKICNFINCGKARQSTSADKFTRGSGSFMDMTLKCKSDSNSIADCLTATSNSQREPTGQVEIICQGESSFLHSWLFLVVLVSISIHLATAEMCV